MRRDEALCHSSARSLSFEMTGEGMHTSQLIVSAIQMPSHNGKVAENLARAEEHIRAAVVRNASLILLPELALNGFELTEAWWETATAFDGPVVAWLCKQARSHGVYIGTTFLEAEGEHFYNTFVLATPGGEIAGKVRKAPPASFEAYFYRGGSDEHVIDTPLGCIGVAICFENLFYDRLAEFHARRVDLVLQPMSAPLPETSFPFRRRDVDRFAHTVSQLPSVYARALGVPVIMANKCGRFYSKLPAIRKEFRSVFPGLSSIVDSDGTVKCAAGAEAGELVMSVSLDPARRVAATPRRFGKWTVPRAWYAFLFDWTQRKGERSYEANERRRAAALRQKKRDATQCESQSVADALR